LRRACCGEELVTEILTNLGHSHRPESILRVRPHPSTLASFLCQSRRVSYRRSLNCIKRDGGEMKIGRQTPHLKCIVQTVHPHTLALVRLQAPKVSLFGIQCSLFPSRYRRRSQICRFASSSAISIIITLRT
jgi:hypothetical protein